eukprot:1039658-Amphidinium_carterae.1
MPPASHPLLPAWRLPHFPACDKENHRATSTRDKRFMRKEGQLFVMWQYMAPGVCRGSGGCICLIRAAEHAKYKTTRAETLKAYRA